MIKVPSTPEERLATFASTLEQLDKENLIAIILFQSRHKGQTVRSYKHISRWWYEESEQHD